MKIVTDGHEQRTPVADINHAVRELAARASIEATPARILDDGGLPEALPFGMPVYVPYLPRADFDLTVAATRRLAEAGLRPVAHIPARAVHSRGQLRDWLAALVEAGADSLLLIAGDRSSAAGPFDSTLQILDSGLLEDAGIRRLGVAGHPEGHPDVDDAVLDKALAIKRDYAAATGCRMWIVTQFVFSTAATVPWLERIRDVTGDLEIHVGLPGPARLKTLIAYAAQCGVSASARILKRRPGAARLLGQWTPDGLLRDLAHLRVMASHCERPLFDEIHLFPFGGLGRSAEWLRELAGDHEGHQPSGRPEADPTAAVPPLNWRA
ncbi:MAG: hypothetical protein U5K76_01125 [Woeseiaceae bacterium]|nr:hypothetical protein [Woeseiaceae bacterium]